MRRGAFLLPLLAACVAACSSGNVKSTKDYTAPAAPPVRNSLYDPYAAYGEANATWRPPVFDGDGTIVKPAEPASQFDRPNYEFAPWAMGAAGGSQFAPPERSDWARRRQSACMLRGQAQQPPRPSADVGPR